MPDKPTHRVLAKTGEYFDGGALVEKFEYVDATPEQASAYIANDPAWRSAKAAGTGGWFGRAWRRVTGADA